MINLISKNCFWKFIHSDVTCTKLIQISFHLPHNLEQLDIFAHLTRFILRLPEIKILVQSLWGSAKLHEKYLGTAEPYLEPSQNLWRRFFTKIVNGCQPLTIFAKCSIIGVLLSSKYAHALYSFQQKSWISNCLSYLYL